MAVDATEQSFRRDVIERSSELPVVVDFWAAWCGPCRTLTPALEKAADTRAGKVELVKVDVDSNQGLARQYGVQGIPAVKAFRDGKVVDEFVGAQPPTRVEAFFDSLVPSEADELVGRGDEESLRRALELEPSRSDAAVALARILLERGEAEDALRLIDRLEGDFEAQGLAARVRLLAGDPPPEVPEAFGALDRGDRAGALDRLLAALAESEDGLREDLRRAIVGILSELPPGDPEAKQYRRRLATALY
ncbi:MAG TPA: thioredoxin [Solirubrobacterales bacterium]|nr:thioredoxin [Solirubrobacterales bacterium]